MLDLPVYDVEFIPLERRLNDRRMAPRNAALQSGMAADRRVVIGWRRSGDREPANSQSRLTLRRS